MDFVQNVTRFLEEQWFSLFAGAVVLIVVYYWGTNKRRKLEAQFPGLPSPKPLPFIGHLLDSIRHEGQFHLQFDEYCKKYGNLFAMSFLAGKPGLVVSDPEMIKQILVKNFSSFHDRPKFANVPDPLDKMLTALEGDHWRRVRNALSPTFSTHKMKMMLPLMNESVDVMLKRLAQVADSGESFDVYRYQQRLTLDVIMSSAFGIKTDCQTNPDDPVIAKARLAMTPSTFQKVVVPLLALLPLSDYLFDSKWFSSFLFKNSMPILEVAQQMIDVKRQGAVSGRKDILDLMLSAENPEDGTKKLSDSEIVANCTVFLLAGYETSATTLGLVCYHLATNPDVQDKLQEEIDSVWSDVEKMPTYETVHELPYLDMVISETLRLCPPGAFLIRDTTEDCVVKGIKVEKKTPIIVPAYSIHRDPKIWPEPDKFDPMRFSPEAKQSRDPYTYMPFGHGPHNCVGMRFAQMEIKLALTRILKKFRFEFTPETVIPLKITLKATLTTPEGNMLKVVHRK